MAKYEFTDKKIAARKYDGKPGGSAIEDCDSLVTGFRLSITAKLIKTFLFRATLEKKFYLRIGEFPSMSVGEARAIAMAYRAMVDQGIDPRVKPVVELEPGDQLFRDFAELEYMPHACARKKTAPEDWTKLTLHIFPEIGHLRLKEVTRQMIEALLAKIRDSHSASYANRHFALLRKMFRLACDWEYLVKSPCVGIKAFREEAIPEVYLTEEEARRLFEVMPHDSNPDMCDAIAFLLLTSVRRQECLQLRWTEVDLTTGIATLLKTKAQKPRHIALSDSVLEMLKRRKAKCGKGFVFHSGNPEQPLNDPRKCLERLLKAAGINKTLRIHDLRHSAASILAANNFSLYFIQQYLGHAQASTTQRYAHLAPSHLREGAQFLGGLAA